MISAAPAGFVGVQCRDDPQALAGDAVRLTEVARAHGGDAEHVEAAAISAGSPVCRAACTAVTRQGERAGRAVLLCQARAAASSAAVVGSAGPPLRGLPQQFRPPLGGHRTPKARWVADGDDDGAGQGGARASPAPAARARSAASSRRSNAAGPAETMTAASAASRRSRPAATASPARSAAAR